jgi:DNA-binding MarR family transcriptional regulator
MKSTLGIKDPFTPTACVCFNLRRAVRTVTRHYDAALAPVGLTANQFSILAVLSGRAFSGGGPSTLGALATRLGMDRTTLTRNLKPLTRDGLVDTQRGDDRRQRAIVLTAAGRARLADAQPLWRKAQSQTVERLGARSLGDFYGQLQRLENAR